MSALEWFMSGTPRRLAWGKRVVAVWVVAALLFLVMTTIASQSLRVLTNDADWLAHTQHVQFQLSRVLQLMTDIETSERGYAVSTQERFLEPYAIAAPALKAEVKSLQQLVADNGAQSVAAIQLESVALARLGQANRVIDRVRAGDFAAGRALISSGEGKDLMDQARQLIAQMQSEEARLFEQRHAADTQARNRTATAIWGMAALALFLLALSTYLTARDGARVFQTEEELATTLRNVGDAVISSNAAGEVRFMNPVAEALTGWPLGTALGKPLDQVFRIIHEETRVPVESPVKKVLSEGKVVGLANHTVLLSQDGTERAIEDSGAPIWGAKGALLGVVLVFRDATKERESQRVLEASHQRFLALADAMPQLVWITTAGGINEYVNKRWIGYTGLNPEDAVRWDIVHPDDLDRSRSRWQRALQTGEPYELELRLRRHDSAYRWFLARASADRDSQGRILRWFGTCTDIDTSKRTEESLRRTEAALREADMRKDVFLATLAHELRNPLAPIRSAARLLESSKLQAADVPRMCAIIGRQAQHMAALLDDLLDVSRITRGALVLKKQFVELREIVDAAVETARPGIDAKKHRLTIEIPSEVVKLEADPVRLTQVVANLLANAAKYTDPDGQITVAARVAGDQLRISVSDSGIGLSGEMLPKIFEIFSQVQPNSERSAGGLGIGLALVKGLIELHGGTVEARSEGLKRGSEFIVFLPLPNASPSAKPAPESDGIPATQESLRILIADDSRDGAESLALVLELAGHEVYVAHAGPDAVKVALERRPQVMVLDVGMPGLTGYEVAMRIRREAWGAAATLIACTGWGRDEDKQQAIAAGFDHHLTKPIDPSHLERLIASIGSIRQR